MSMLVLILSLNRGLPSLTIDISPEKLILSTDPRNNVTDLANTTTNDGQVLKPVSDHSVNDPNLEIQLVSVGLKNPSNIEFLCHDDILVLVKNEGTVKSIVNVTM